MGRCWEKARKRPEMQRLYIPGMLVQGSGHGGDICACGALDRVRNMPGKLMTKVKNGDTVAIHYTGTLLDGTTFDSSEGREPLSFEVGSGMVIQGLDVSLPGMSVGEKKVVKIACVDAYGPIRPEMRQVMPREGIPDDIALEIGLTLQMQTPDGHALPVTVVDLDDATVTLDANHPLAGMDLQFDFELVRLENGPNAVSK